MSAVASIIEADGIICISGVLDFNSTPKAWLALKALLQNGSASKLSLDGVESSNSAALAMLIEAKALAAKVNQPIQIVDLPQGLSDLANMSNVLSLLEVD